ncbi:hypothetical protein EJC47_08570 [Sphingomonas sp. TF3]|uniref:hypothetical protein n=1 Tax=Sphingomonas sp. TF3 TaxID=2495580 RepID=UPI000F8879C0|nr:hypothetical protein [Sphingomonas sp. TF3]RUN77113.1 hypothetical protein EJC47_08570 [Sphingomonas sp. TF3]
MPSQYTIYLVNQSSSTQTFWCFLTRPAEIASDPNVFANSSASIAIDSNDPSTNYFVIPVQYSVGAGASNNAVGLDVQVTSTISQNSDLAQVWNADYANAPPKKGPKLTLASTSTGPNSIKLVTNSFNQEDNESLGWYSNQSFGIQTASGFMGMTWSPSPNQSRTLTPKLSFYISVGSFGSSTLADWTQVSNDSAQVSVPGSFTGGACTVTLLNNGKWKIAPGKPAQFALLENLAFLKSDEHSQLMAMAYLEDATIQQDTVTQVHWDTSSVAKLSAEEEAEGYVANTFLTGTITVATALTAGFAYFVVSGVQFSITSVNGATTVNFSYSGAQSAATIQNLLVAGAQAIFGGNRP